MKASVRSVVCLALSAGLALALNACGSAITKPTLTPVSVVLAWTHQAQFAGMYAADQEGYYQAEGLAVTLRETGPTGGQVDSVLSGTDQFGVVAGDVLLIARSKGKAVQAVAAVFRRTARVYVALSKSGIARPQDFAGQTIAVPTGAQPAFAAMMTKIGISSDKYDVVLPTADMGQLYSGSVQVRSVYLTSEVVAARAAGYELNVIYPDDYGVHNYGDVLFASDALIAASPDLVLRFVRASLKGWTYAVEHPAEVGALVAKYKPGIDVGLQNDQMAASLPLVNTGEDQIGWMKADEWAGMAKILEVGGTITSPFDVTGSFTMKFLGQIYP